MLGAGRRVEGEDDRERSQRRRGIQKLCLKVKICPRANGKGGVGGKRLEESVGRRARVRGRNRDNVDDGSYGVGISMVLGVGENLLVRK